MGKSRQRESKNELIIRTKINWFKEILISFISIIVWTYCIGVLFFFIGALFDYNNQYLGLIKIAFKMTNSDIRSFLIMVFCLWLIFYIGLWSWKNYNLKRFGPLKRRSMPNDTTKEDLLRLKLMSEEDFQSLHQSRVVVFEKNPIKDI
ncbi:hypothetical protein ACIFOT_15950 [Neobacillus sp. NRS-1170]|uniref:hypothetical protein n=1 Tax=Neobacillus sp. NRS-1170 TaxID=3233898 RepID=UPI003D2BEC83